MTNRDVRSHQVIRVELPHRGYDVVVGTIGAADGVRGSDGAADGVRGSVGAADGVRGSGSAADRAIIADERALALHGATLQQQHPATATLALTGGEGIKSFAGLQRVLEFCATSNLSRGSTLVAFGGGTIGDLTGLAASLYKRGIDVVQIPTTLLAQVDASVGGKTAINLDAGKNLAGTFHHPRAVYCDTHFLATLDDGDFSSGLGEVLKTAIIGGVEHLDSLEANAEQIMARDPHALSGVVARCVRVKADIVAQDPTEQGARRALNLGHTFGHAIEHAAGYGRVPHGVAVATGLVLAARAAEVHFGVGDEARARLGLLLTRFGLPDSLTSLRQTFGLADELTTARILSGLQHDKKGKVGQPRFVLARAAGDVDCDVELEPAVVRELIDSDLRGDDLHDDALGNGHGHATRS